MLKLLCFCSALSFYVLQVKSQGDDYSWEKYKGTIPPNAILASDDPNNPVYVGLAEPKNYNCSFAILPSETQEEFQCNGVWVNKSNSKNILTVTDKTKFKWQPVNKGNFSDIDIKDLVESNHQDEVFTYWYVARMKGDDGTLEVGDIINKMFYSSKKAIYMSEGFEALVHI